MKEDNKKNNGTRNLSYLDNLSDYKVSDSDKDIRGWPVKDANDHTIGEVDNLLVSKANNRVVYLEVEMDKTIIKENHRPYSTDTQDNEQDYVNDEAEKHVIIPIGMVHLDTDNDTVRTPKISREIFARTKRMKKGSDIDRNYETNILESYDRSIDTKFTEHERDADDTTLYDRPEYDKENQGSNEVY